MTPANTPEPKAEQQTKIEKFAKDILGIELFPAQVEMIEAWSKGQTIIKHRRMGLSTANKVVRAYVAESLKSEQPHPTTSQDSMDATDLVEEIIGKVTLVDAKGYCFTISEDDKDWLITAIQAYANRARIESAKAIITSLEFEGILNYQQRVSIEQYIAQLEAQLAPQQEGDTHD